MCRERPTRRGYLAALAAAGAGSIAGCPGGGSTEGSTETPVGDEGGTDSGPTDGAGGTDLPATETARTDWDTPTARTDRDTATTTPTPPEKDTATGDVALGTAKRAARDLEDWRSARVDLARDLSSRTELTDGSREERQAFLEGRTGRYADDVYRLHLVDLATVEILASSFSAKTGTPLNTREAPWKYDEISYGDDDVFVARAVEAHARSIVSFVAPVETDREADLVLVVMTSFDIVAEDLPTTDVNEEVLVVDDDGRLVGGTRATIDIERTDGTLERWAYWSDDGGVLEPGFDGEAGVVDGAALDGGRDDGSETEPVAFAPVDGFPWVVVVQTPVEDEGR